MRRRGFGVALLALAGCEARLAPAAFDDTAPAFRPDLWFAGPTRSAGVFEAHDGAPLRRFTVDGVGETQPDGALQLRQTVRIDGDAPFERWWRLRVAPDGRTVATGPAIAGEGQGSLHGRLWHLTYVETLPPGGWRRTVRFEHWMYLSADGATLVNRFAIRKLGLVVARATEVFTRGAADFARPAAGR